MTNDWSNRLSSKFAARSTKLSPWLARMRPRKSFSASSSAASWRRWPPSAVRLDPRRERRPGTSVSAQFPRKRPARQSQEDLMSHRRLVHRVFTSGEGTLMLPHSGSTDQGANPTDFCWCLGPVKVGNETKSVVEIFQRPNKAVKTQRGYLRFLLQMCELASDYLKNRQLRHFTDRQALWGQLEQFTPRRSRQPRPAGSGLHDRQRRAAADRLRPGQRGVAARVEMQDRSHQRTRYVRHRDPTPSCCSTSWPRRSWRGAKRSGIRATRRTCRRRSNRPCRNTSTTPTRSKWACCRCTGRSRQEHRTTSGSRKCRWER